MRTNAKHHRHVYLFAALCLLILFSPPRDLYAGDGQSELPRRYGIAQATADALAAIGAGDIHIISVVGKYEPEFPFLARKRGFTTEAFYYSEFKQCGYVVPTEIFDFFCTGEPLEDNFPCEFLFDYDYVAAYNTVVYNWLKRDPDRIKPFAVKNREAGTYPEFPRHPEAVLDLPDLFTREGDVKADGSGSFLNWILLHDDSALCMAALPDGWGMEGNFVHNRDSLSFPALVWVRLANPTRGVSVSLLKSIGSREVTHMVFDRDPKGRFMPESYVPFHGLKFMSAWQFLWFYVSPLAKAVYPDCETGELEGEPVREGWDVCLPEAALPFAYRARDGRRMEARATLTIWNRGVCPSDSGDTEREGTPRPRKKFWGIEQLVIVSKPANESFSPDEARALLQRLRFSPEATAVFALPPEEVVATADQPNEGNLPERLHAARRTEKVLRFRSAHSLSNPMQYMSPPPDASRIPVFSGPLSLENALVEMLMSGLSLYPDYPVSEWKKASRQLEKNVGGVTQQGD